MKNNPRSSRTCSCCARRTSTICSTAPPSVVLSAASPTWDWKTPTPPTTSGSCVTSWSPGVIRPPPLGLENGHAAHDIRELRDLLEAWRDARRPAWQTAVKVATTGILAALLVGAAIKLKLMGGPQ